MRTDDTLANNQKNRCTWADSAPDFPHYHDTEWGFPVAEDQRLFEKLCLETFQSGLSWRTILAKRDSFREAFQHFDIQKVAQFEEKDIADLLENKNIVRNKRKILAVINNAQKALPLIEQEGSLAAFLWHYEPAEASHPPGSRTTCPESIALAKALKQRGWQFLGPTTLYAFMQSMGMVNDHEEGCFMHADIERIRLAFQRPK
ncbi:MAG: DNA-3-methyladenine glycosylase I [Acidiferrobacterales bacterium]|nr:DNA-3-methyladenine glycosylase I [Acidiferrobacterales bacterium]